MLLTEATEVDFSKKICPRRTCGFLENVQRNTNDLYDNFKMPYPYRKNAKIKTQSKYTEKNGEKNCRSYTQNSKTGWKNDVIKCKNCC